MSSVSDNFEVSNTQILSSLVRRRGQVKASLTRVVTFLDKFVRTPDSVVEAASRLAILPTILSQFEETQARIEELDTEHDNDHLVTRDEFESRYHNAAGRLSRLIENPLLSSSTTEVKRSRIQHLEELLTQNLNNEPRIRSFLPSLPLETFDGEYTNWPRFYNAFMARVDSDQTLSRLDKFHFLRSCLRGAPLDLIDALEVNDSSYSDSMRILKERYERKRLITEMHIRSLLEIPKLTGSTNKDLREFLGHFTKHLEALRSLKRPVEYWDDLLIGIARSKLDLQTLEQWDLSIKVTEEVTFKRLSDFLESRAGSLESFEAQSKDTKVFNSSKTQRLKSSKQSAAVLSTQKSKGICVICSQPHMIYHCPKFKAMQLIERYNTVKQLKLCFNCLCSDHGSRECKSRSCLHCKYKHNSLLHGLPYRRRSTATKEEDSLCSGTSKIEQTSNDFTHSEQPASSSSSIPEEVTILHNQASSTQVLLSTVLLVVQGQNGKWYPCRAIIDSGSQINILSQRMAQRLSIERQHSNLPINGVNGASTTSSESSQLQIASRCLKFSTLIDCYILPRVTARLPIQSFDITSWKWPSGVRQDLADPNFNITSDVDLLLGAEIFCEILKERKCAIPGSSLWLYNTSFGWVLSGLLRSEQSVSTSTIPPSCLLAATGWMPRTHRLISKQEEEIACERCFVETHTRMPDGRFVVKLPFREESARLGGSMGMALKRFLSLENKLERNAQLAAEYKQFMKEYEELGHMSPVMDPVMLPGQYYYIPHHAVFKESSITTKLRVVFDASMKTTSKYSLNDILMTGPVVQPDLVDILLRFRLHRIALIADVSKMYRQVLIAKEDRQFQRILWRTSPDKELIHYNLNTVTYGMAPASFLATRVLQELSKEYEASNSQASRAVKEDFYVDDFVSGACNIENAKKLYNDVSRILESGGMMLRKWCSNSKKLRDVFSSTSTEAHYSLELSCGMTIKSLGLSWCPDTDELMFLSNARVARSTRTKRDLLSTLNSVFDPLGFLSPVLIRGKIFLQELWQLKLDWDDILPEEIQNRWTTFVQDLESTDKLRVPRFVNINTQEEIELHGFCDASQKAYGACIYIRQKISENTWHIRLICAKSRVAPTTVQTIPRLELCGAHLLAELISQIANTIRVPLKNLFCWTDSSIVLSWICSIPAQWKTYVANRVSQIIQTVGAKNWRHISTTTNPADCISRGITSSELCSHQLWWSGPDFLTQDTTSWPESNITPISFSEVPEKRAITFTLATTTNNDGLLKYYSNWNKLLRISVIWMRFIAWTRWRVHPELPSPLVGPIQVYELRQAKEVWTRYVQRQVFHEEINTLKKGKSVLKGPLKNLSPYLDNNIIRVGGRIGNSNESIHRKHPAVLPFRHQITEMILRAYHLYFLHMGPQGLLANVRNDYWPLRGRDTARSIVHQCQRCFRARPIPLQPSMGHLPAARVTVSRPFTQTGVDFAGPLFIRVGLRKVISIKAYVAVFVCLSTKAVHLEAVSNLSAEAFMAALRRFISRRGKPSHIWSDNATNFVGTNKELQECFQRQCNLRTVPEELTQEGIQWVFIPPGAPHFGGIWEAAVKSFKHHFIRLVTNTLLNFEELCTILAQIEACLNSRPLTAISSDPADFQALTPSHFLVGSPLLSLPEPDLTNMANNRLRRWALMQKLTQTFWIRWRTEYLSSLQGKAKWLVSNAVIKPGTLAILKDETVAPLHWRLVRVISTHPGKDGVTRVVTIRTSSGQELKRPTIKICPLPNEESN